MKIEGKSLKVYTGPGCGSPVSPSAVVHPTVGNTDGQSMPARAMKALVGAVKRTPKPKPAPAGGPNAIVHKLG